MKCRSSERTIELQKMEPVSPQPVDSFGILATLMEFHTEGRYCDTKIQIGEEIIPCQRSILAALSEFFDVMFRSDFKEGNGDADEPIILRDVDSSTFKEILNSVYTGHVNVNDSNVYLLLHANDFLQIRTKFIEGRCYSYISRERTSRGPLPHAIDLLLLASSVKKQRFVEHSCGHILEHVRHFTKDAKFMEIPFEVLDMILVKFKEQASATVDDRGNILLNVIICWLNHSRAVRCQHRKHLMRSINSSCISMDYVLSLLNEHEVVIDEAASHIDNVEWIADAYDPSIIFGVDTRFASGTTCVFTVKDFSKPWSTKESPKFQIHNLVWSTEIRRSLMSSPSAGYLSIYSCFKGNRTTCSAAIEYTIISQKEGLKNFVRCMPTGSFSAGTFAGMPVMKWETIVDKERGFIKDDSVIFQICISI